MIVALYAPVAWTSGAEASECSEVGFLPSDVYPTFAKDMEEDLIDIHTYNKFFTFQIDRPKTSDDSTI